MPKTKDQRSKTQDLVAILLAAGQSKRMGAFKPLLPFGETTVIRSCVANLQAGGVEQVIVVTGHRASDVESNLTGLDHVRFVVNPNPKSEMSASIACGAEALPATAKAVVIALTDQPAIPSAVIRSLTEAWRKGAKLVVPEFDGRGGHPVLVDLELRERLLTLDPQRGLKELFDENRDQVLRLPVNSSYIARDMDTWDDYCALHEDVFGAPPNTWTAEEPGLLPTN
ncbi:MAG TPA: nucleotidyltransferase family protein [Pyrinomonadaceae bacterium]|nr:nucleotidyltransferase family protein [Pyrinomonadaceae bacterium]